VGLHLGAYPDKGKLTELARTEKAAFENVGNVRTNLKIAVGKKQIVIIFLKLR